MPRMLKNARLPEGGTGGRGERGGKGKGTDFLIEEEEGDRFSDKEEEEVLTDFPMERRRYSSAALV